MAALVGVCERLLGAGAVALFLELHSEAEEPLCLLRLVGCLRPHWLWVTWRGRRVRPAGFLRPGLLGRGCVAWRRLCDRRWCRRRSVPAAPQPVDPDKRSEHEHEHEDDDDRHQPASSMRVRPGVPGDGPGASRGVARRTRTGSRWTRTRSVGTMARRTRTRTRARGARSWSRGTPSALAEPSGRERPDDPVDTQAVGGLEPSHGTFGPRTEAAVERTGSVTGGGQAMLERKHERRATVRQPGSGNEDGVRRRRERPRTGDAVDLKAVGGLETPDGEVGAGAETAVERAGRVAGLGQAALQGTDRPRSGPCAVAASEHQHRTLRHAVCGERRLTARSVGGGGRGSGRCESDDDDRRGEQRADTDRPSTSGSVGRVAGTGADQRVVSRRRPSRA